MGKIGKNSQDIQESNRTSILRILAREDVVTRVDLSHMTGLKQATITNIINDLLESGAVSETGTLKGGMGRRSIGIRLHTERYLVLGIKIARRSYSVGVFNMRNELLEKVFRNQEKIMNATATMNSILTDAKAMFKKYPDICAIGVAVPGPYLRRKRRIALMTESVGWEKVDVYKRLSAEFDVPVCIEHDANAGALAEWHRSPEIGEDDVLVHLLASGGIGTGVVIDGKIIHGYRGIFGEVGHMSINSMGARCACGNCGCLEMYCSALAFVKDVLAELPKHPESTLNAEKKITADTVFRHMRQGDSYALACVKRVGTALGYGVANIVNIYDPREIVISDIMSGGGDVMMYALRESARERLLPDVFQDLTIRYSNVPGDLILYGAGSVAIDLILDNVDIFFKPKTGSKPVSE